MFLTLALGALVAASIGYYAATLAAMCRFRRRPPARADAGDSSDSVSILKPAAGAGAEFAELLRSFATQDHPDFEILVGVRPGESAARDAALAVQAEFPALRIEVVDCPERGPCANAKTVALECLARRAANPVWVASDADIRVPRHYLRTVCAELAEPNTGLVTCLYRGESGGSLASRLEAVRINAEFPAQVLLAQWLQGLRFGLGSTLAFRRETLARLGGFRALHGFVGDDYSLGAMVAAAGLRVGISSVPVATQASRDDGTVAVWRRQLRWSRTIRKQRPAGHAGLVVTFATVWCLLAVLVQPSALWPLAALGAASRLATALMSASLVGSVGAIRRLWLVPAADIAAFVVWTCSYFGNTVTWAGRRIRLGAGGRILE